MGKIFVFDVDDTLIIHAPQDINHYAEKKDNILPELIKGLKGDAYYLYTNGTHEHGKKVSKALDINPMIKKIFARDTLRNMKPHIDSFRYVNNEILRVSFNLTNDIYFFDDMKENIASAKKVGWKTVWISPEAKKVDASIDYAFSNIYEALIHFLI